MKKMAKKQKGIPRPLVRQLYNHCGGGFIIFRFDEDGMPSIDSHFDDPAKALALQHFVNNWSLAVEAVNLQSTVDMMNEELGLEDPDGDGADLGGEE